MTQFHGDGEHEENNGKVIEFMGDCDENGALPYPVRPLVDLGWKWGPMKGSYDAAAYATYFGDPANRKKLWKPTETTEAPYKVLQLPRMIHLPGELGILAATGTCIPFELSQAAGAMAISGDYATGSDDLKMLLKWCMAASQLKE